MRGAASRGGASGGAGGHAGVTQGTVFEWLASYREGGPQALRARPVRGKPPKLNGARLRRLYRSIGGSDRTQLWVEFALCTREMARELIRRELGVRLPTANPGRLLRRLGPCPQRPRGGPGRPDPAAISAGRPRSSCHPRLPVP
jgi:transposase